MRFGAAVVAFLLGACATAAATAAPALRTGVEAVISNVEPRRDVDGDIIPLSDGATVLSCWVEARLLTDDATNEEAGRVGALNQRDPLKSARGGYNSPQGAVCSEWW